MIKPLPRLALAAAVIALGFWLYPNYYTDSPTYNSMIVWPEISKGFETNRYISRGGISPFLYSVPDALPTPPEGYDADAAEAILAAYPAADIPREQQVSIVLTQLEGRSYEDAAAITGASVGTVKSRINRARQKLVEAMQHWQNPAHDPANERRSS